MAYQELKKLYYGNSERYAQEYLARFHSDEAIRIEFQIGANQAFFLQNAEVLTLAYKIAKLDKEIGKLCDALPGIATNQYSKKCLIDEIVITNKIEGVHSSRKEIGEALDVLEAQSRSKGKHQRFIGLVNKYLKLMAQEKIPLQTSQDIRSIYDEVFLEEVIHEEPTNAPDGKLFRKGSVSVYSETGRSIHKGLLPEERIIEATERALCFLNDDSVDELFRICVFHKSFSAAPAVHFVLRCNNRCILESGDGLSKSGCIGSLQLCGRIGECHRVFNFDCGTGSGDQLSVSCGVADCFDICIQSIGSLC